MCDDRNTAPLRRTSRQWRSILNYLWRRTLPSEYPGGKDYNTKTRWDTIPRRVIRLLALSTDQEAQLQAILSRFQDRLLTAEMEEQRAFTPFEKSIMSAFDEGAIKQRQAELVAASAKRVQDYSEMLIEIRKVLNPEQVLRTSPELTLDRNDHQFNVQLPEGFSDIGLSDDQHSQVAGVFSSRVPKMMTLSWKEKVACEALAQAIFSEQFDEATVNQRREGLVAVIAEQIEVNTGILFDARNILTPSQTKLLNEITPDL